MVYSLLLTFERYLNCYILEANVTYNYFGIHQYFDDLGYQSYLWSNGMVFCSILEPMSSCFLCKLLEQKFTECQIETIDESYTIATIADLNWILLQVDNDVITNGTIFWGSKIRSITCIVRSFRQELCIYLSHCNFIHRLLILEFITAEWIDSTW